MSAFASKKRKSDAGGPEDPEQTMYVVQDIYRDGSYREDHTNGVFSTLAAANEAAHGEQREIVWELDGAVSIELRRAEVMRSLRFG